MLYLIYMGESIWLWVGFSAFVLVVLSIDLGLFDRKAHVITYRQAITWSGIWIGLALLFSGVVFWRRGTDSGIKFLTGYIIELSLSVDNLFVFLLIFSYFKVPAKHQHRVLYWGVLGALAMRATMILLGTTLIARFHWIIYIFGAFLVYTGLKMFRHEDNDLQPEQNPIVRLVTRYVPITRTYEGSKFFTNANGRKTGTLLLLVLIIVEVTDLVFAVDSIPAIFAVTIDPFIVYTSNVFAILGLRTFYFLLAGVVEKFHYLKTGLAIVLTFIGTKMLVADLLERFYQRTIPPTLALAVVAIVLLASVAASLVWPQTAKIKVEVQLPPDFEPPFNDSQGRLGADEPPDLNES